MKEHCCLECKEPLKGRADKKFCDDQCRNNYNNKLNSDSNKFVRNINNKLRKNRRILQTLAPEGKKSVRKEKLLELGYEIKYFTHLYQTKDGTSYHFCYEYGFKDIEGGFVLIVRDDTHEKPVKQS